MDLLTRSWCAGAGASARSPILALLAPILALAACTSFSVAAGSSDAPDGGSADSGDTLSSSSNPDISIPDDDQDGVTDTIDIDSPCTVDALRIDVDIQHEFRGDLFITLTSPEDTTVVLKTFDGDDEDMDVIGTYPTTLTPFQDLSLLAGEDGQGPWQLQAADLDSDDTGTFRSWGIHLICH